MNGKIKSYIKVSNDGIDNAKYFNVEGKIIKEEDYRFFKEVNVYTYTDNSILLEIFDLKGNLKGKNLKKFNKEKNVEEDYDLNIYDDCVEKCFYKYDQNQKLCSQTRFDSDDQITSTSLYNVKNNEEYTKHYNGSGILESMEILKFNDKKQLIRKIYFEKPIVVNNSVQETQSFEEYFEMMEAFTFDVYEKKVDVLLSMEFVTNDIRYQYDEFGNKILEEECECFMEGPIVHLNLIRGEYHEYNELNMVIRHTSSQIHTDWDATYQSDYKYFFDEKGNISEKIMNNSINKISEKFNYNNQGSLISYIEDRNDSEEVIEVFYDDFGNEILKIRKMNYEGEEYEEETTRYEIEYY